MLLLAMTGTASVKAQMRIGGEDMPNQSAVLDLNPDDNASEGNSALGLALPRVNLRNSEDAFPLISHVNGMTVYNMATVDDVSPGVYVNNGAKWLRQFDGDTPFALEKDSIVGNEVKDAAVDGGLVRYGTGTDASPYTLGIAASGVASIHIADNVISSEKIADGAIIADDLSSMGANNGEILKWNGTAWTPAADMGIISVSGATGITVSNGTTAPVVGLPPGTKGQVLTHNGTSWSAAAKWSPVYITNTSTASNGITTGGYSDAYVWSDLQPGLYSLRMRASGYIKFLLQSDVAFGTSAQFEINSNSHDYTAEIIFHYVYTGNLRLKALCTGNCPARLVNLTLHKFE
jgi:hypothetical protein